MFILLAARAYSILLNSKGTKAALSIHLITAPNASYSFHFILFPCPKWQNLLFNCKSYSPLTVDCGVVRLKGHNIDSNSTRLSLNSSPNGLKSYIFFSNFQPLYSYHTISISKSICPYWQGTRRSVMYVSSTGLDSS